MVYMYICMYMAAVDPFCLLNKSHKKNEEKRSALVCHINPCSQLSHLSKRTSDITEIGERRSPSSNSTDAQTFHFISFEFVAFQLLGGHKSCVPREKGAKTSNENCSSLSTPLIYLALFHFHLSFSFFF